MKIKQYLLLVTSLIIAISGCSRQKQNRDILFQISTIDAISKGLYDGKMSYGELREYGNFGIGTFDGLDGELFGLAGELYQIKADGIAYPVEDSMKTPFAVFTFFESDKSESLDRTSSYEELQQYLDNLLPTKDIFYAIKIEGVFPYIKTRCVPKQNKPYPPFSEVVKNQQIFEFHDVRGTIVGFRFPAYIGGINYPGYHLHFLAEDRKSGGHLLECQTGNLRIEIDYTPQFRMALLEAGIK